MFWLNVFFAGWVALMALRGYVRGFWVSLFDLGGVLVAYFGCVLFGQKLVSLLLGLGLAWYFAYCIAYPALFFLFKWAASLGAKVIFTNKLNGQKLFTWQGAALGSIIGLFSGLVMLWCFNFVNGVFLNQWQDGGAFSVQDLPQENRANGDEAHTFLLVDTANKLMSTAAKVGAKASGANVQQTSLVAAMAEAPTTFTRDLRNISQSQEIKQFFLDTEVQYLMATDNTEAIVASDRFQELRQHQNVQSLRQSLLHSTSESATQDMYAEENRELILDKYIADQLSYLWKRAVLIKNDDEVQLLLQDEEVQRVIEQQDLAGLVANPKVQQIIAKALDGDKQMQNIDFTQFVDVN